MKYRSRIEIATRILRVAEEGAIKTKIAYQALLSFKQQQEYIPLLISSGLLKYVQHEKMYFTTEKGKEFLRMYWQMEALFTNDSKILVH